MPGDCGSASDSRRRSPCASASPAGARSSAASRCRSCRKGPVFGVRKNFGGDLGEGATATFDVVFASPTARASRARASPGASKGRTALPMVQQRRALGLRARQVDAPRRRRHARRRSRRARAHCGPGRVGHATASTCASDGVETAQTSVSFTVGWSGDQTADTPDLLDMTLDKASYGAGDTMQVAPRAALRRQGDARGRQRQGARPPGRRRRRRRHDGQRSRSRPNGAPAPTSSRWRIGRSIERRSACRAARSGVAWFEIDRAARALAVELERARRRCGRAAGADPADQGRGARSPARRRASPSRRSMSASST